MAISIMFYHLIGFLYFPLDAGSLLGRLGVYGVSIFFVLSGLSMAVVYANYFSNTSNFRKFYARRIFRIWPLLWLCVLLATIPIVISGGDISYIKILANLTTTFGFVRPDYYINVGAWSIGNEMVYYAMTPFLMNIYVRDKLYGNIVLAISLAISIYFSSFVLDPSISLAEQWSTYINPFNNLFLYLAGIAIYFNLKGKILRSWSVAALFITSLGCFALYPANGDTITVVTGLNRIIFLAASIALVVSFYKFSAVTKVPYAVRFPLEQFGIATYGVYLLHPLVFGYLNALLGKLGVTNIPPAIMFSVTVVITVISALLSYTLFEKKVIHLGKRLTQSTAQGHSAQIREA